MLFKLLKVSNHAEYEKVAGGDEWSLSSIPQNRPYSNQSAFQNVQLGTQLWASWDCSLISTLTPLVRTYRPHSDRCLDQE